MGKIIKKVAGGVLGAVFGLKKVAAVALIAVGVATGNFALISAGVSLGLSKKPKTPSNSAGNIDRLRASIETRAPRKLWFGITAGATDIRDEEFTDDQAYFHRFIVVASHKIEEITAIFFDDKLAWTLAGGVQGEFVGYLTVAPILEGSAGNAINISARMGTTRRYTGCAYVHLRYKLTGNSKKTDSPFAQSITTRITIRGKGGYVYDPRLDSTVAGGSGSHRADDQATWEWDDDANRNPALGLLWYLLGWRIDDMLAVGKGIPPARIDLESFAIAANLCDEPVALAAGGTEPRYRADGVWSEGDSPTTVIDMFKACMNADLDDVDGKLRLTVFHNDLATPVASFTADDVLGDFDWQPAPPLDQTFNIVRGIYTDASDTALYQPVDYPQIETASPDGIDRIDTFDLPMVESAAQAQRLARLRLNRQTFGGIFEAAFQATAWAVQKNSVVELTFPAAGFTSKLFRVAEMELREDGVVPLKLREESEDIYTEEDDLPPVEAVATTPYDPTLNPIIGAIDTTEQILIATSYPTDSDPADGLLQADATSITVETHNRTYSDRNPSVTGATLTLEDDGVTAIVDVTTYHVYYDDAGRMGGAVTFKVTQNPETAANSAANPLRHYVGTITTAAGGNQSGGGLPPGWDYSNYYP
ncbi:MAG: hypothetical protein V4696_10675 [Pseudomonadota bacterium]